MRLIEERRGSAVISYVYEPDSYVPLARLDAEGERTEQGGLGTTQDVQQPGTSKTIAASASQTSAERQKAFKSSATGAVGASRSPHHCSARPIQTTGCQAAGGSPNHQSTASASSGTPIHTANWGQPPAGVSNKSQWSDTAA